MLRLIGSRSTAGEAVLCVILVVLGSVLFVALGPGLAAGGASAEHREIGHNLVQQNNSSVHHENPDNANEDGNLSGVRSWLSEQMGEVLIDCTEGVPARQYGACDQLDKEYPEWLSKHVDVNREIESEDTGEQDNGTDTNTSESFGQAKENQQQFVSTVQEFNETRREYRNARENGSTQDARARGRELLALAQQTRNVSTNLTANYRTIGNVSGTNVTGGINTINSTTENISAVVRNISAEQFVNTTLTVDNSSTRISYLRPLSMSGQLTDENETPLSDKRVVLRVGNYSQRTTTTESGGFSFTYRPTLVSLNTQQATVRYIPRDLSPYLSNQSSVPVSIEQVEPSINVSTDPNRAGFNDPVTVTGRVSADGDGVSSVPFTVSIDGHRLNSARLPTTNSEGRYQTTGRLPASMPPGNQTVRVSIPLEGRAVAGVTATGSITIVPTPTQLSITAPDEYLINQSNTTDPVIPVAGRLTVENGSPAPNRPIELRLNGSTVSTVRTGQNGTYATNISIPQQLLADLGETTPVTLVAVYSGQGTSFKASQARTQITIIPPERGFLEELLKVFGGLPTVYQFLLSIAFISLGGLVVYALRRQYTGGEAAPEANGAADQGSTSSTDGIQSGVSLIETARKQLSAGDTDRAILTAYAAIRNRLSEALGLGSAQTHREFLAVCRERTIGTERFGVLSRLTEAYEEAAFAPQSVSEETSSEAIKDAQLLEDEPDSDDGQSDER